MGSSPRRISVVGSTGSGKTTFARQLARRLGVDHVELDALNWAPNWKMVSTEIFLERVARALEGESWVIDGNYGGRGARDLIWSNADTVVWLDPPLRVIFARLFHRSITRIRSGEEIWPGTGNRETYRNTFLSRESLFVWALRTYWRRKREYAQLFARPEHAHLELVHLRSPAEALRWLESPATAGL